jgi:PAS domain S-box-containing protein
VFIKDREGNYLLMNAACRELLGVPEPVPASQMSLDAFFSAEQTETIRQLETKIWGDYLPRASENLYRTPDGRTLTLLTQKTPVSTKAREEDVLFAVATDVTAHSELEERLAQKAHDLQERMKEVRCLYDVSRILLENQGPIGESTLARLAARIPSGWQHPDIAEVRIQLGDETGQTPGFRDTEWVQRETRGQGTSKATIVVAYAEAPRQADGPLFLDEEQRLLESLAERLFEASRRAHAEDRVRFQARLLDAVGESVIATDLDGKVNHWNRAAEEIYGWTADEALGRSIMELTPADGQQEFAQDIMEAVGRGDSWSGEFLVQRKDGTRFSAHVTNSPLFDEDGELVGVVGVSRDVTVVKELEAKLQQAQRLEALGRLAGGIAHDFNNMLTAIQGNTQLLLLDADEPEAREHLEEIDRAAARAADLTSQLLAFSRRQMLAPRVLSVAEIVADMESMVYRLLGDQVELSFEYAPDAGNVRADPTQLSQILINLVVNARDAITGKGRIGVRVANRSIQQAEDHRRLPPPGEYVVLTVEDSGHGMDEETRENLFEPFFTTKQEGKGTGLGLATVYGIIKQSGGHIEVETALGEGSRFQVYLPRVFESADRTATQNASIGSRGREGQWILICEDEPTVRRVTKRALERQGYRVLAAASGPEALDLFEAAEDGTIRLVVSDVVMPEMSGLDLQEAIQKRAPGTRFLLVSGYAKPELLDGHDASDEQAFLRKPFDTQELTDTVADLLDDSDDE